MLFDIHKDKFVCYQGGAGQDIYITVNKGNPVFNWNTCSRPKTYQSEPLKQIVSLIKISKRNYINNLNQVLSILSEMVYYDKSAKKYNIKQIPYYQLNQIEVKLKRVVIIFFMQSLTEESRFANQAPRLNEKINTSNLASDIVKSCFYSSILLTT